MGEKLLFDPQLVVPNEHLSLKQGAVVPWAKSNPPSPYYMQVLASLAAAFGFDLDTPWEELPGEVKVVILHGTAGRKVPLTFTDGRKSYTVNKAFEGVIGNLNRRLLQTESAWMREELAKYQTAQPCETCEGKRLKPEALSVKVAGRDISSVTCLSVSDAVAWYLGARCPADQPAEPDCQGGAQGNQRAAGVSQQCRARLPQPQPHFRYAVSGGESQRIRLASQIGSGLSGVLYVLDEPSIGLHQRDNDRLARNAQTAARSRQYGDRRRA